MAITAKGRPNRQWIVEATPCKGLLRVRLDDAKDETFWQEILIPHDELLSLLAAVHRLTYSPDSVEELTEIDGVARMLGLQPVAESKELGTRSSVTTRPTP